MLYWLSSLRELFTGLNLFRYITVRAVGAGVTAFLVCILFAPAMIRWLERRKIGQSVRQQAAAGGLKQFHQDKAGTPTMGGVLVLGAITTAVLLWGDLSNRFLLFALGAMLALGILGFMDDMLKLRRKNACGLRSAPKLIGQACVGVVIGLSIVYMDPYHTFMEVPFFKRVIPTLGVLYIPFAALVVVGTSNAVNLTDGLDGLASGCLALAGIAYGVLAYITSHTLIAQYLDVYFIPAAGELTVICSALVGACLGFLWFNAYPAELFMGDTGALALGGVLGVVVLYIKKEILLMLVGGIFVAEALSVIVQVASYKLREQKRVFLMAPVHHHFQMKGWPEPKVTVRFWIIGALLALLSVASLKVR